MSCYKNGNIRKVYAGNRKISKIYKGSTLLFSSESDVFEQTFTASGSITFPNSLSALTVICVGGGGGGGGGSAASTSAWWSGGGGGSGGYSYKVFSAAELESLKGKTISFTVGGGGPKGDLGSSGSDGGQSKFQNMIANGGKAGVYNNPFVGGASGAGGAGGTASGGSDNKTGNAGANGGTYYNYGAGGVSLWNGYGAGGRGGYYNESVAGTAGCIYIRYEY